MFDVAIVGAGAAGMMCAAVAGQRGLSVVLIDHASRLAEKIRISGGGRCNFTNLGTSPGQFLSENPHFCRSALAGYTPQDFLSLMREHRIAWHEKHRGQLFCDNSSEDIIEMLRSECDRGRVSWRMPCAVREIAREGETWALATDGGAIRAGKLVIATGGMAIPQLGATDYGLKIARQFGLKVVEPRPALVPLTFDPQQWQAFAELSGLALEVSLTTGEGKARGEFLEDLLFTHRGLSGPAILQISSYWKPGTQIRIDLAPGRDLGDELLAAKTGARQQLHTLLSGLWPKRLADTWLAGEPGLGHARLADVPDRRLRQLAAGIHAWSLIPTGTAGYKKAEVMRGGVDTRGLDQKSMQARAVPGLYFIGETVDVTGWLGGYNFQWAWASAAACGRAL
ncbi:BaiN/RdsA family NAD(P)/FAD-dependent oxidoreductase [Bordetella avium]|uniref:NAD(P)/FAD-dependent oxidoreductase n=1 Tax=Bordetella avium TaxID=521 RepID=UPI000E0A2233|nr:NAD(P)/FAD-dependent oxidoreductase [Bordetella avium]AZY51431.1 aminoacetone oxidase family FAD-binding enzyme [Bordetella avium]RIQ15596.1 aminoacetone oxidase family FAD-binding enzyme [Bordetella avium]RIQ41057.1 aminoacetone oxidase family FAD-binding enzyme [Bordetella avium]RIQ46322.1 aminoacetone oxidase family FAD-binding enzyme [Bordetella avium]RIQ47081.1 aminoacetone oxidase family FAD-binding enzyme [Bordetella avium]